MRYTPDLDQFPLQLLKHHGPYIIGQQDTDVTKAFGNVSLSCDQDPYRTEFMNSPLASPLFYPKSASLSFGSHSECQNEQSLPSTDEYGPGFTPRSSGQSSPWSPAYSPYSDFGMQSSSWAAFSPGVVGQERGIPFFPHIRSTQFLQQQRSSGKPAARQSNDYSSGHHNVVCIERIRLGTDVRTTVRNPSSVNILY